eukprot:evm.model.scf_616EXC.2 EVM.evm.TU.scf_616EXC.2   scf_616EXC:9726-15614(-)
MHWMGWWLLLKERATTPVLFATTQLSRAPSNHNLKFYTGFVAAFDPRTRNPVWVLEHLSSKKEWEEGVDRKNSEFYEDKDIEERFRNRLVDFRGSGYDRGHLAPAANHKDSQKAMDETFVLSNISPQVGKGFNRDYWARFEKYVRDLTKSSSAVWVITGPVWLPQKLKGGHWQMNYPMIGQPPTLVSVPTHFYKVVLAESKDKPGNCMVGAFVMPNAAIPPDTPLTRFVVPIEDLECAAGVQFFPGYISSARRNALDTAAIDWRQYGMQLAKPTGPKLLPEGDSISASSHESSPPVVDGEKPASLVKQPSKTGPGGQGAIHLCENGGCTLPAEEWWIKGPKVG